MLTFSILSEGFAAPLGTAAPAGPAGDTAVPSRPPASTETRTGARRTDQTIRWAAVPAIDDYDGFLIDFDGVVWVGRDPVPGSPEALATILAAGKGVVFVTNKPTKRPGEYAERLAGMGVHVGPERIVTAGIVAARLAAEAAGPGGGALVLGFEPLRELV